MIPVLVEVAGPQNTDRFMSAHEAASRLNDGLDPNAWISGDSHALALSEALLFQAMAYAARPDMQDLTIWRTLDRAPQQPQDVLALRITREATDRGLEVLPNGLFRLDGEHIGLTLLSEGDLVRVGWWLGRQPAAQKYAADVLAAWLQDDSPVWPKPGAPPRLILLDTAHTGRPQRRHTFWLEAEPAPNRPHLDNLTVLYAGGLPMLTASNICDTIERLPWFAAIRTEAKAHPRKESP